MSSSDDDSKSFELKEDSFQDDSDDPDNPVESKKADPLQDQSLDLNPNTEPSQENPKVEEKSGQSKKSGSENSSAKDQPARHRHRHYHEKPAEQADSDVPQIRPQNVDAGYSAQIKMVLSQTKAAYGDGEWHDCTDENEVKETIHPIIAENHNLKRRLDLLVKLLAESRYEIQQNRLEFEQCVEVANKLKEILGEPPIEVRITPDDTITFTHDDDSSYSNDV